MWDARQDPVPDNKHILELVRYELDYRRKKQWDIFSWAVTILVSVIGGVIVVTTKESIKTDLFSRGAMAVALIGLTLYAAFWIGENIRAEEHADELIKKFLVANSKQDYAFRKSTAFAFGYVPVVLLIGFAAVAAVLLVNANPIGLCFLKHSKDIFT